MTEWSYSRAPHAAAVNLGEELALLDIPTGAYLGFNATAAHVWRMLDQPRTLDDLCARLTAAFDVDDDRCRIEVTALLARLVAADLVTVADG